MALVGKIISAAEVSAQLRAEMFQLMDMFYSRMERTAFESDFESKDYVVLLIDENQILRGFTTQQLLWVETAYGRVRGMFSGDTIIHKDYWGSMTLFQTFARFYFKMAAEYPEFYWFLICKGYKTYRLLPLFFSTFYPCVSEPTPPREKAILDAYAALLYPEEYDCASGIIRYRTPKDALRCGIADITEKERKNAHTRFFEQSNPDYLIGNDLTCLVRFSTDNLRPGVKKILLGGE